MKKLIALLLVVVVLLSAALGFVLFKNFSGQKSPETETTYKTETEKKINEEIEKLESENTDGWREAYIDFLSRYTGEFSEFNEEKVLLGYVDDNDVPELFISEGSSHVCDVEVYTFENNIVTKLCETGSFGMVNYFERQGIICGNYIGQGVGTYWVYSVEDCKVQELYSAFTNEGWAEEDFDLEININGIDVTSEQLDEFLESYFSKEKSIWLFDDKVNVGYGVENGKYTDYINSFGK